MSQQQVKEGLRTAGAVLFLISFIILLAVAGKLCVKRYRADAPLLYEGFLRLFCWSNPIASVNGPARPGEFRRGGFAIIVASRGSADLISHAGRRNTQRIRLDHRPDVVESIMS